MTLRKLRLAMLCALVLSQPYAMAGFPKALGYLGWWQPQSWRSAPLEQFDRLLFFDLKVDSDGNITERHGWPEEWADLRNATQESRTPLDLTLTLFDPNDFNRLFASFDNTQRLINEAASLVEQPGVAGLQLDFEIYGVVRPQVIENFRTFLRLLSVRLQRMTPPRNLSVFFPVGAETALYDSNSLALVDQVVLQGYDVHWRDSKTAGPVAPLGGDDAWTWEKMTAHGESLGVSTDKLFLGFPLFGYEWPVNGRALRSATQAKGSATSFAPIAAESIGEMKFSVQERVRQYGAAHDPISGSSHYQFRRIDGQYVEGWFEDWWALGRKIDFLTDKHLGGIAFFLLGYDAGQLVDFFMQRRGGNASRDPSVQTQKRGPVLPSTQ